MKATDKSCPYVISQSVAYCPSPRGKALNNHTGFAALQEGRAYRIESINSGVYIVLEGFEDSGGLYWTEFQPLNN